jgi:GLPGLI family protein
METMKTLRNSLCIFMVCLFMAILASAQKKVSEFTIVYNSTVLSSTQKNPASTAINTIYIKGNKSRLEVASGLVSFSTIFDGKSGSAVVLKELSGQKLLIRMNAENWQDMNKHYEGIHYVNEAETKVIAGYKCQKATALTKDSLYIEVFYTKDIISDNKDYDPMFRNLDGLPLEYEIRRGNIRIQYMLTSINLNPVPASKFDIPTGGYREMTYEESKKLGGGK